MATSTHTLEKIARQYQQAFYLYDEVIIMQQAKILQEKFKAFDFLYSIKTNPFLPIVQQLAASGLGADAASVAEVEKSLAAGMKVENIFFSAPGRTKADFSTTIERCTLIADSYHELALMNTVAAEKGIKAKVGIRINPNFTMAGSTGTSSKFGVDEEGLLEHQDFFNQLTYIEIIGIHTHLRSQILDARVLYQYYDRVFQLAQSCQKTLGWNLTFINFGGGLGIPYSCNHDTALDVGTLSQDCEQLLLQYKTLLGVRLLIETGRFVVCEAGTYITPIVDVKESRGTKYLITRNGLNGFMRPAIAALLKAASDDEAVLSTFSAEPLFTSQDAFDISILGKTGATEKITIAGNLCTATDLLAVDVDVPQAEIGDFVVVTKAGSYAYSLSPLLFSSHPLPLQLLLKTNGDIVEV